ncbi:MAG: hypothetical protein H6765_02370 [Candidatus Peribacteria bacterium]|nr:MAG: hypothetical protein H6765_02370 [Candidatus Peribacteria bacterium]
MLHSIHSLLEEHGVLFLAVKQQQQNTPEEVIKESRTIPGAKKRYVYWRKEELLALLQGL